MDRLFRSQIPCFVFLLLIGFPRLSVGAESLTEAKAAHEKQDKLLNDAWGKIKKSLDEWTYEKVLAEQRTWLKYRDEAAEEEARREGGAEEGKEKTVPEYWMTQMYLTRSRVRMLEGWLNPGDYEDWSGEWIDGYGGLMRIVQKGERDLFFTIEVVRGPTYHTGGISGKATVNRQLARFSDKDVDTEKVQDEGETWLNFSLEVPRIEVTGANTGWYHGARAYFGGKYVRLGPLTEKQKQSVISGEIGGEE